MIKKTLAILTLISCSLSLFGQSVEMDQLVSLDYRNVRLGDALDNISDRYRVNFSYSAHYVPVDQRVDLNVEEVSLGVALDELFEETEVVYASIGDQVVLRKGKKPGKINKKEEPFDLNNPTFGQSGPAKAIERDTNFTELTSIEQYDLNWIEVISESPDKEFNIDEYYAEEPEPDISKATAQISLVPNIGTNRDEADARTNNISVNVFGGENGGVDGVEIGGLFNKVSNDVNGVQLAGLFNAVGGDVGPSKFIDGKERKSFGIQIAGLVNTADNVHAVQLSGLLNLNKGSFRGLQGAGLGNRVKGDEAYGAQLAGLFNINNGNAEVQAAGLTNIADDINGAQISGLFNKADKVNGFQVGLINVSDTISGASVGLLNFVKKGYNQIELGGGETMQAQLGIRFGSHKFYNLIQFGAKFNGPNAYGIGYGFGINLPNIEDKEWQWNTELVASQIIENKKWNRLNLLSEFRVTAEYRLTPRTSLYFGPVANMMFARTLDKETKTVSTKGTEVPLYSLIDNKNNKGTADIKGWIGFRAGIRFGRNK